ncbi:MAG: glycoside hydrolase [Tissierellia bacterium]|nr:glycoside hydrolase [Tissierellia bacterium]
MKKHILVSMATTLILLILISIPLLVYLNGHKPSEEAISISDHIYLVFQDEYYTDESLFKMEGDIIYLSFDFVKEYIDPDIFYDEKERMLIITDQDKVLRFIVGDNRATVNHREFIVDLPIKEIEGQVYIPEDILSRQYGLDINYWENTNAITIDRLSENYIIGQVIMEGGHIRTSFDIKSPIIFKDVDVETNLFIFEEYMDWYKVRTFDGIIGYMEKKYIKIDLVTNMHSTENNPFIDEKSNEKINLTWDYTHRKMENFEGANIIYGVNVLSPTWFEIIDEKGNINDKGNKDYVIEYQNLGYKIWPLISNGFNPDLTSKLLSSSLAREKIIKNIVLLYDEYGVDGINIDFENVYLKDRDLLTQFVRELYPVFKEKGMTVTMDVTPISVSENWSMCYDRKRLSESVDYIVLMAYDQHWATSPVAGSVAQYTWVEASLKKVLEEVPREKLILGMPFYTRLWTIEETTEGEKVTSLALSMEDAKKFIEENSISLEWDEESGQYYGEVVKEDKTYKIWLEDDESLRLKASLVNKYGLAGIATWRKGFEMEDIWPALSQTINLN